MKDTKLLSANQYWISISYFIKKEIMYSVDKSTLVYLFQISNKSSWQFDEIMLFWNILHELQLQIFTNIFTQIFSNKCGSLFCTTTIICHDWLDIFINNTGVKRSYWIFPMYSKISMVFNFLGFILRYCIYFSFIWFILIVSRKFALQMVSVLKIQFCRFMFNLKVKTDIR